MSKTYACNYSYQDRDAVVTVTFRDGNRYKLPLCLDKVNHSPTGFAWGYGGSGPAQLAFAICYDILGDENAARRVYQQFKWKVIATLAQESGWSLDEEALREVINEIETERTRREEART